MATSKPYKISDLKSLTLVNEPVAYDGKTFRVNMNSLIDGIEENPVQLAAMYRLRKMGVYTGDIKNPIGSLYSIFIDEKSDCYNVQESLKSDMENMAVKLFLSSAKATNLFLFELSEETDTAERVREMERVASAILTANDDTEIGDILIELLYSAMVDHFENWPPPNYCPTF